VSDKLALVWSVGISIFLAVSSTIHRLQNSETGHPTRILDGTPVSQRLSCSEYYPLPDNHPDWRDCIDIGRSLYGGLEHCSCSNDERLVSYHCGDNTYDTCVTDSGVR
jgi:hypothetical protein